MAWPGPPQAGWKFERNGEFEGFLITGWRYVDLAVWHIKISPVTSTEAAISYMIAGGEFYPTAVEQGAKFAILHLMAIWETDVPHSSSSRN